jgi:hypothetical protein
MYDSQAGVGNVKIKVSSVVQELYREHLQKSVVEVSNGDVTSRLIRPYSGRNRHSVWVGLGWVGLGWVGLGRVFRNLNGLGWVGLDGVTGQNFPSRPYQTALTFHYYRNTGKQVKGTKHY